MSIIEVKGKEYTCIVNYKENDKLRDSFNRLTMKTYGFDFEKWYQDGYWKEKYMPYSLLDGQTVIANVSISIIDFFVMGEQKRYVQIGAVMTDELYRNQGLSRVLIEKVLSEWENKCDLIYLFANDSVLDFYPKLGFVPVNEYQCKKDIIKRESSVKVRKLNMSNEDDRNLLYDRAAQTLEFSKIAMRGNASLIMFYCTSFMKDSVYYIHDYDTVVVADFNEDTLFLQDVFRTKEVSLDSIINVMSKEQTRKVVLGFTPIDTSSYEKNLLKDEDTTLFIKERGKELFEKNQLMFPVLSHA